MKITTNMKLAAGAAALLGAVWYFTRDTNKCPKGGVWKVTATGGYCAQVAECPDCVGDAGTQSLGKGLVGQVTGAISGIGSDLGHALGNLFGSAPTTNPGTGPVTSPDDPRLDLS